METGEKGQGISVTWAQWEEEAGGVKNDADNLSQLRSTNCWICHPGST